MKLAFILFTIAFIIIVVGTVAKARKLDNLHKRIEHMRHRLDRALLQRAACALGIARSGVLDPASSLLLEEAALEALHAVDAPGRHGERSLVESNLSQVIKATAADPGALGRGLYAELEEAETEVQIARKIHNGAVVRVRQIRSGKLISLAHLAGRAPLPETINIGEGL